jgi:hypothetical protein
MTCRLPSRANYSEARGRTGKWEERQKATAIMASTIFLSFPIGPLGRRRRCPHRWRTPRKAASRPA